VGIEAIDGLPVSALIVNITPQIGAFFGQLDFNEEFYNGRREGTSEVQPGKAKKVRVKAGATTSGIDFVTNKVDEIANFGRGDFLLARNIDLQAGRATPAGRLYAVAFPAEQVAAIFANNLVRMHTALFFAAPGDASVLPLFAQAVLTTGTINPDGTATIDLQKPLQRIAPFVAQEGDFSPWYLKKSYRLTRKLRRRISRGTIEHVFLVLQLPTEAPFPGPNGFAPDIGVDGFIEGLVDDTNDTVPPMGLSFISEDNGATFIPDARFVNEKLGVNGDFNIMFSLIFSEKPRRRR